jgi:hypothetical protein|tara:strand:- start:40 stop:276 length:237 start_codon:yes stop_codon:yes gene_type:complete
MIEKLKKLEQEAMDELDPEVYVTKRLALDLDRLSDDERGFYLTGYLEGLQRAILLASEDSSTMSYEIDLNQVYDDNEE